MHPAIELPVDSELSLCGAFLHARLSWVPERSTEAKHGFARSAPQKAMGIWKRGAGMATTHHGNLALYKVENGAILPAGAAGVAWIAFIIHVTTMYVP